MQSVKGYFTLMYTVYISMLVVLSFFLAFALVITEANNFSEHDIPYLISNAIIMLLGFFIAYSYFQKKTKEAKQKRGLREKLMNYQKALLVVWIIVDIITCFSIVFYIISGEHVFVCTAIFSLVILLLNKPSLSNLIEKLDLEENEQRIMQNPKSAI